jgi:hypothetical protein
MALARAAVGGRITSALENAQTDLLEGVPFTIGLKPVVPSAVSGAGVALSTRGRVQLTAATTPAIDGCFTSTYDRYVVEISGVASANASWVFVFRGAGVDVTAANYDATELLGRNSVTSSATVAAGASWAISGTATLHKIKLELDYPADAQATLVTNTAVFATNPQVAGVNNGVFVKALSHRLSTSYDGFKLTLTGGTFTGQIRIYGLNDNV